jgi:phospholipid/cholesterol/gamma-HCH transport system ATP-binding protein
MQGQPVIQLENVAYRTDGKDILRGVDLLVEHGQVVAVLGESGSGKTTIVRLVMGLIRATGGSVRVFGREVNGLPERELNELRKRMGMVFQGAALFDSMTVGENAAFALREHTNLADEEVRARVRENLSHVGLEGVEDLMPVQLSGGMQKRVGIARALALNPEIVLYDEPTGGLDPPRAQEIEQLIGDLSRRLGVATLLVSHDVGAVLRQADRIALLHEGRIEECGAPEQIRTSNNPIVRRFVAAGVRT